MPKSWENDNKKEQENGINGDLDTLGIILGAKKEFPIKKAEENRKKGGGFKW